MQHGIKELSEDGFFYLRKPFITCSISGGGSDSSGSQQQQSTGGFQALSPQIQGVFNTLAQQAGGYLNGGENASSLTGMYTPPPLTSGENQAINTVNQGFTPSASQLSSSINEQMNPYNQNVINQIQQQAYGQNSVLNSQLSAAGQFGSNRAALGANDIANSQANNIGALLNPEYNTALNNALTTIPQLGAQSAQAQLQTGQLVQGQQEATQQAPLTALQSLSQILGILPTNSSQSTGSGQNSSSGFNFGLFSSDERLKENIIPVGTDNGFPIYSFNYICDDRRFIGVMAQDVEQSMPDAVQEINGLKSVDYGMIGVEFRRIE